jgi:outer membrane protein
MRAAPVLLSCLLLSIPAAADVKLGYVDLQRALREVGEGQAATAKLKSELDRKKAEFEAEQKKLREDSMVLDRQASAMSEEVRVEKLKALQGRMMAMGEKGQKLQVEFVEKERVELKKLFDKMDAIIADIAQREGLTMVFEKTDSGLLYSPASFDLTNELVRTYNDKYPVKGFKPAAPAPGPGPGPKNLPRPAPKDAPLQ